VTKFRRDNWVVTYKIEFHTAANFGEIMVTEFYRGAREECLRIKAQSTGGGEHDRRRTDSWIPIVGPACDWDQFLEDNNG
jgi:hypothetical protein